MSKLPKKLKVRLKRKDIRKGGYCSDDCPIQRAVSRKTGAVVRVHQRTVGVYVDGLRAIYLMDERTAEWLRVYNGCHTIDPKAYGPFTINLTRG